MQKINKIELQWVIHALTRENNFLADKSHDETITNIERELYKLRAEQIYSIQERLVRSLKEDDKRISIAK